jgi:AcrR family transcriptional regulator
MRVTAEKKIETRERIVASAIQLFENKGFASTTTRDIAREAGIAAGTMFNYFSSKEALAMSVFEDRLGEADAEITRVTRDASSLAESLFAMIAIGLRHLEPFRPFVAEVFEITLSPFVKTGACAEADRLRESHLNVVQSLVRERAGAEAASAFELVLGHLYWSLYLGVAAFWARDESPNQEDTLAIIDQTTQLFVKSLNLNGESPGARSSSSSSSSSSDGSGAVS